jgi:hypothetical protein
MNKNLNLTRGFNLSNLNKPALTTPSTPSKLPNVTLPNVTAQAAVVTNNFNTLSLGMKVISVIVVILVLIIVGYTGYSFLTDLYNTYNSEPYLVKGTKLGKSTVVVPGYKVQPSVDQKYGAEFAYSMWIYINDWTYKQSEWKHILHKGSQTAMPLQAPGIWLYPNENKMAINMNTFYSVKESCDIENIPIAKWFHLTVVVIGRYIDVYINGRLKKRCQFKGVPKQNFGDVYINQWQGFDGFLSNVRYFNYALPFFRIEQLVKEGPSKESCIDDKKTLPPYLAPDWWEKEGFGKMPI